MSIQIIEIRQFQGPATVELSGVGVPEIVEVRQGPAGLNGPNEVTSATTSDGTCDLSVLTLDATQGIGAGLNPTSGRSITANGGDGTGIYVSATSGTGLLIEVDTGIALDVTSNTGNDIATFRDELNNGLNIENPRGWITWVYEPGDIYLGRLQTADITANRYWTLPDRTGNIALTEDYTAGTATIDVLNATVQGTLTAAHIHGNVAGSVYAHVRAGENLAKGDPVYVSGSHGTGANLIAVVSKADASNAAKMPAVGVMDAAVSNNANGHMVITGTISDLDTNAYAVNTVLYVALGGGWTSTPPAANSQPVAIVERSNTNNGAVIVKVNGLASSGGNGASDANKLARFSTSGTLPISNIGDLGANVATFLATPTSANLAAAVTDETGTGSLVFSNAPTFTGGLQFSSSAVGATSRTNLGFISAYKTTNEARSSSTLAYDTDLQITLKANTNYVIECLLDSTVASGGTLTQNFVYSGTLSVGGEGSSTAGFFGATRLTWSSASTQSVPIISMALASATTPRTILHKLTLRTNTTGTFAVQWSNAAGTGTTTINARSYLTAYEV